jgi:hypothetical protein
MDKFEESIYSFLKHSPFSYDSIKDMPFPELLKWFYIAIKDNQTEHQKAKAAQEKAENESKRRGR